MPPFGFENGTAATAVSVKTACAKLRDVLNSYKRILQGRKPRDRHMGDLRHIVSALRNPPWIEVGERGRARPRGHLAPEKRGAG